MLVNNNEIDMTLSEALRAVAAKAPEKQALVFVENENESYTFDELVKKAEHYAEVLLTLNNHKPFTAILCMDISPKWYFYFWGVIFAGGRIISLSSKCAAANIDTAVEDTNADFIITSPELNEICSGSAEKVKCVMFDDREPDDYLDSPVGEYTGEKNGDCMAPCVIQYTSGTSAKPKCAMLSHRGILYVAYNMLRNMDFCSDDRYLMISPVFHIAGILGMMFGLFSGATSYPLKYFTGKRAVDCIKENEITAVTAVPTMFAEIVRRLKSKNEKITTLKKGALAGSNIAENLIEDIYEYLGTEGICTCYGLTEFSPIVTMVMHDDPIDVKKNSAGLPFEGTSVKLMDLAGEKEITSVNAEGEIYLRGPGHMAGYINTDISLTDNDFFKTGDMGMFLPGGYLKITGRASEMIIKGGENISPAEIEKILVRHEKIEEAAVMSVPDSELDEEILAVVTVNDPEFHDEKGIREFLRNYLEPYKIPKYISFKENLIKNANGKLDKAKIREEYLSENPQ